MGKEILRQRMYGLVPYNLSDKQKLIQYGHAQARYVFKYHADPALKRWIQHDETVIALGGGTTNNGIIGNPYVKGTNYAKLWEDSSELIGSMQQHYINITKQKIKTAVFFEPDINDAFTAFVFLADERVWDKNKYPSFELKMSYIRDKWWDIWDNDEKSEYRTKFSKEDNAKYQKWLKSIGGPVNEFLRNYLGSLQLA